MATTATPEYQGPERRKTSEEKREGYLVERKLRMEMLNTLGRRAIVGVLVLASFWVGRVESSLKDISLLQQQVAVLVEAVKELAGAAKAAEERDRARETGRTEVLLQLQQLNTQMTLFREESQRRTVQGEGR